MNTDDYFSIAQDQITRQMEAYLREVEGQAAGRKLMLGFA